MRLDDDTLLERVSTLADDSNDTMRLTAIQLACIFGLCAFETSTQHNDELLVEKCSAYVDKVSGELEVFVRFEFYINEYFMQL